MSQNLKQLFFGTLICENKILNVCWLIFRIHLGLSMAIHAGFPKMTELTAPGWFADQVAGLGFTWPSPMFWATVAAWGEFIGGLMIAFGICTRLASFQLAFQFFIISFFWYDEPEFFTGMYYQQLLFWCFMLIGFLGAGKYSLDWKILNKMKSLSIRTTSMMLLGILVLFSEQSALAQGKPVRGSGKLIEKNFEYKDFDKINMLGMNGNVTISLGRAFRQSITIDDNFLTLLNTYVKGGVLYVALKGNESNKLYLENTNIVVNIEMPEISVIKFNGNGKVAIDNFTGRYLRLQNDGNADITLKGSVCDTLDIINDGNGDIKAEDIRADSINIERQGNGDILINTDSIFKVLGDGNGDIINYGKGKALIDGVFTGNGNVIYKGRN